MKKISKLKEKQLLLAAFFLTAIIAYFSVGFHHFDEHFQIIEFMNFKLGNTTAENLPWEFHRRMRPWFQPYLFLVLDTPLRLLDSSPFTRVFFLRLCSGLFSISSLYYLYKNIFEEWLTDQENKTFALFILLFTWFIPYVAVRPSAESLSASFFFLGISLCLKPKPRHFLAGLVSGLCYLTRYQMALPIAVIWFWGLFSKRWKISELTHYAIGIIIIIALGILLDTFAYGHFTFALYNYFKANFLDGVLKHMGVSPWYKYFEWSVVKLLPPISFILTIGVLTFWKNNIKGTKSWLTWITFSFFAFHSFIGHKEYRFIFLCALFAPIMSFLALKRKVPNILIVLNFIFMLLTLKPANKMIPLYKFLYESNIEHIYYKDETPLTLVGLPLKFYFKKELRSEALLQKPIDNKYIFTKRFASTQGLLTKGCNVLYLNYPKFIFNDYPKQIESFLKRQKVMGLFHCKVKNEI